MAHKRKDTISQKKVEYAKHLRPFEKRMVVKSERRAVKTHIRDTVEEIADDPHIMDVDECGRW
jgi:hypothetical protein